MDTSFFANRASHDTYFREFFSEDFHGFYYATDSFNWRRREVNRSFKFLCMTFRKSRETFRSPECRRPIKAKYNGRAVFAVN